MEKHVVFKIVLGRIKDAFDLGQSISTTNAFDGLEKHLNININEIPYVKQIEKRDVAFEQLFNEYLPKLFKASNDNISVRSYTEKAIWSVKDAINSHAPRYSYSKSTDAPPFDDFVGNFEKSKQLIGSHNVELLDRIDFFANAGVAPIFKQLAHALNNSNFYRMPDIISSFDELPISAQVQIRKIEKIASSESKNTTIKAVNQYMPQILIPDETTGTGYLSITPLASMSVVNEIDKKIESFTEKNRAFFTDYCEGKTKDKNWSNVNITSVFNAIASFKSFGNLTAKLNSVTATRIFHSTVPVSNVDIRNAVMLVNNPESWCSYIFKRCHYNRIYSKQVKLLKNHLAVMCVLPSVSVTKRNKEDAYVKRLAIPFAKNFYDINTNFDVVKRGLNVADKDVVIKFVAEKLHIETGNIGDIEIWSKIVRDIFDIAERRNGACQ